MRVRLVWYNYSVQILNDETDEILDSGYIEWDYAREVANYNGWEIVNPDG